MAIRWRNSGNSDRLYFGGLKKGLEEAQAGIKIAGRNINNLKYTDDTTLMAEGKELKSLLMKVKEESEKVGLKVFKKLKLFEKTF